MTYNKVRHLTKSKEVSCIEPETYSNRFLYFMNVNISNESTIKKRK